MMHAAKPATPSDSITSVIFSSSSGRLGQSASGSPLTERSGAEPQALSSTRVCSVRVGSMFFSLGSGRPPLGQAGPARAANGRLPACPCSRWGLAARGALVEAGGPDFHFPLSDRDSVWTDDAARIYAQAAAAQWDPEKAIDL